MFDVDVKVKCTCLWCDKEINDEEAFVYCNGCDDEHAYETVKNAVREAYKNDFEWTDREGLEGFKTEEEKDIFLRGVKRGFLDALFWVSDYLGDDGIEFWQKLAEKDWK